MNLATIAHGQRVRLASGGPTMTVIGFSPNGRVWVEWENVDGCTEEASFVPEALVPVQAVAATSASGG